MKSRLGVLLIVSFVIGTMGFTSDEELIIRWNDKSLDNGLEYSISSDFCERIIPMFIDKPSCSQLRESIQQTFGIWSEGHATLRFVDVSGLIQPKLPNHGEAPLDYGAEIDLFVLSPQEYPLLTDYAAYGGVWHTGGTVTDADIIFNSTRCYHFSLSLANQGCNHFQSLLLHEIGHTLPLSHSDEVDSVMHSNGRAQIRTMLSVNDVEERDSLYPNEVPDYSEMAPGDSPDYTIQLAADGSVLK